MSRLPRLLTLAATLLVAACGADTAVAPVPTATALRVVNALPVAVDLLLDGAVVASAVPSGAMDTVPRTPGTQALTARPVGGGAPVELSVATPAGATSTVAFVQNPAGGADGVLLDDTSSVVPANMTRVRVLHLAPNAGTLQVYRTQPDFPGVLTWQSPFTYQSTFLLRSAPFYQSTVGRWDIRVWQSPAGEAGWSQATLRASLALKGGERATLLLLDAPGGGVRIERM